MKKLLPTIQSPLDLRNLTVEQLYQVAAEIREVLCSLVATRTAHFASNLGVVELCLALHTVYDFRYDRLIWDTGHQVYPHKLVTGRYREFGTMRTKGGLMGYPNPQESLYDLFMTGHAGCSLSAILGMRSGDQLLGHDDRYAVAVIGDGAFPSGIVFEAMNNVCRFKRNVLLILNDNKMSICPRVGGMGQYLDRLRTNPYYTGFKTEVVRALSRFPLLGDPMERLLTQLKDSVKAGLHGGMLFEDLGFRYIGPIDGHNIAALRKYLEMVRSMPDPVLLHVFTEKGHGFQPAQEDPVYYHTPPALGSAQTGGQAAKPKSGGSIAYTNIARDAIQQQARQNPRVTIITAAMCQGNKLEPIRNEFPDRFFDVGICESHAVAFAAGQAKAGLRPIVTIYSTFLQRAYDQLFQEVALQNLPVMFMMDRAGLCGPDGPTHHGVFDLGYLRVFPHLIVMAPGDAHDLGQMVELALELDGPCAIRYPKANAEILSGARQPVRIGRAERIRDGADGTILCAGALLGECLRAADKLHKHGIDVAVINARFVKPLDQETILSVVQESPFVVTVEEAALAGGFGSAVLELATDYGVELRRFRRLGIPDMFIEHGERSELLADLGLDCEGIARACWDLKEQSSPHAPREDVPSYGT